jgi:hypothetical protein
VFALISEPMSSGIGSIISLASGSTFLYDIYLI